MPRAKKEKLTKVCTHCKSKYETGRSNSKFCKPECRLKFHEDERKAKRAKQREKRLLSKECLFDQTAFATYLIAAVKHAGTVQILSNHTPETFLELHQLCKNRTTYSGFKDGKPTGYYELSHIQPVKGATTIGLLHPLNLVISTKTYNRKRSNKVAPKHAGLAINKSDLLRKWLVDKDCKKVDVLKKIKQFLGKPLLEAYYKEAKLNRNTKNQVIHKILSKHPERSRSNLERLSLDQLYIKAANLEIKILTIPDCEPMPVWQVLAKELKRLGKDNILLYEIASSKNIKLSHLYGDIFITEQIQNHLHSEPYALILDGQSIADYLWVYTWLPDDVLSNFEIEIKKLHKKKLEINRIDFEVEEFYF